MRVRFAEDMAGNARHLIGANDERFGMMCGDGARRRDERQSKTAQQFFAINRRGREYQCLHMRRHTLYVERGAPSCANVRNYRGGCSSDNLLSPDCVSSHPSGLAEPFLMAAPSA